MGQSFTCLHYHLIFSTKSREPLIVPQMRQRLYDYIGGIIEGENGRLLAAGGTYDHVHLLAFLHQRFSVADVLRDIKANSSKWIHQTFDNLQGFAWQEGYGAFTVSYSNISRVHAYIDAQEEHHRLIPFQEEFVRFLKRHGIQYDPRYIWD
ncbi:MAG TPA: IS200/IS605 family transposase [Phycisphaerae bacterium]|jgi:REP element-mobilizing transposase RayT|nr:IS200/IS605 family transposase [Phycisphaerae bacterium]HOB74005.1 IS200/IS605 family transposase [Phycisphaerae bacterium]HOJ53864.1 IS200/IS605 family transposase [Phycisphaerae bacterium]HOL26195.1 IS200/IS605 family transposase [Phycisphaerae bacterium]HPP20182.1 IS200/IS605 family transposase [Phycisphaerae bacterium]